MRHPEKKSSTSYLIRSLLLVIIAISVNIALGHLVQFTLQWLLFLDSIGMVLAGALLEPLAGAATGAISNILWAGLLGDQTVLPYSLTDAFIGWAAGYAVFRGAFERFCTVVLSTLLVRLEADLISAPITAHLFSYVTSGAD